MANEVRDAAWRVYWFVVDRLVDVALFVIGNLLVVVLGAWDCVDWLEARPIVLEFALIVVGVLLALALVYVVQHALPARAPAP